MKNIDFFHPLMSFIPGSLILLYILGLLLHQCRAGSIDQVGSSYLMAYASNIGEYTYYRFSFAPQTEIQSNAFIEAIFPQEFSVFDFPATLECTLKVGTGRFIPQICKYNTGNIIRVQLSQILSTNMELVIGLIHNPSGITSTSSFRLQTLYGNVVTDRNDIFGFISYATPPGKQNSSIKTKKYIY